jgi:hypothetical protein
MMAKLTSLLLKKTQSENFVSIAADLGHYIVDEYVFYTPFSDNHDGQKQTAEYLYGKADYRSCL